MRRLYADIAAPIALGLLTYTLDEEIGAGTAVEIPVGGRIYQGIVWRVHDQKPAFKTKPVRSVVSPPLRLTARQMKLWEWIADYYMCSLGEVMAAALPSALKPSGMTAEEFAGDRFRPRSEAFVALCDPAGLNAQFEGLGRAKKQYAALVEIVEKLGDDLSGGVRRKRLDASDAVLAALKEKRIVAFEKREVVDAPADEPFVLPQLTPLQQRIANEIRDHFATKDTVLLHGVTGSGKTEIYTTLAAECLARGEDVLYLVPEIALTAQLIRRVEAAFGARVVPYHSRYSARRRAEAYRRVGRGGGNLVLGARSAMFLPFERLGLVVVDEEHENSYKQSEPAPRYHARDGALVLAGLHGARTILGSATPSLESWANALAGKYGLATLGERYGASTAPRITVSDTLRAVKRGERRNHFNKELMDRIRDTLAGGRQVILFQNRRGYAPYAECPQCGAAAGCPRCNVALTLHRAEGKLRCHYCGYRRDAAAVCTACGKAVPEARGFGTEKIEDELAALLPGVRIARLDSDIARSRDAYNRVVADFEARRTDILIGTQMVAKGFDFEGVSLVGILNADNLLNFADFRAGERAYALMTQVAGRAGRREVQGEVVIQTAQPAHPVIAAAAAGDWEGMCSRELAEREAFAYPPYCRLTEITLRGRDPEALQGAAVELGKNLRAIFGKRLLGPVPPPVDRIRNEHLLCFTLKVERDKSFAKARRLLAAEIDKVRAMPGYKRIAVVCNVDPL